MSVFTFRVKNGGGGRGVNTGLPRQSPCYSNDMSGFEIATNIVVYI